MEVAELKKVLVLYDIDEDGNDQKERYYRNRRGQVCLVETEWIFGERMQQMGLLGG